MNHRQNKIVLAKNFVRRHRTGIAVSVTALAAVALHTTVVKQHNDFLKEHNLFDEFYSMNEI